MTAITSPAISTGTVEVSHVKLSTVGTVETQIWHTQVDCLVTVDTSCTWNTSVASWTSEVGAAVTGEAVVNIRACSVLAWI